MRMLNFINCEIIIAIVLGPMACNNASNFELLKSMPKGKAIDEDFIQEVKESFRLAKLPTEEELLLTATEHAGKKWICSDVETDKRHRRIYEHSSSLTFSKSGKALVSHHANLPHDLKPFLYIYEEQNGAFVGKSEEGERGSVTHAVKIKDDKIYLEFFEEDTEQNAEIFERSVHSKFQLSSGYVFCKISG